VVEGEQLRAGDLARAAAEFGGLPADLVLGFAPAPGARRTFTSGELARLALRHGLTLSAPQAACFERATERLTADRVTAALRAAIPNPDVHLEVLDFSRYPVPHGAIEFPPSGLASRRTTAPVVWRGRLLYDGKRTATVWARVRMWTPARRAVAVENLPAGKPIAAGQVRLEEYRACPFEKAAALEDIVGQVPRRGIRAGEAIAPAMLGAPDDVQRGEVVDVEVSSGAARVRVEARAETAGRAGDTILLRNLENGRRFPARVEGRGKVGIDAN
jgi:flagella basal body P-ring formation protein FlgA